MLQDIKVGILGGGQLGAMLIRHGIDFGAHIAVLDNEIYAPCSKYTSLFKMGFTQDYNDVMAFGKDLDVLTIEKEAVNTQALKDLRGKGVKIFPSPEIIATIQDKYQQKQFLEKIDIPVARCIPIANREDLKNYIHKFPGILKQCTNGYDGKGVMKITNRDDINNAFDVPSILEEYVDIAYEISVIVARDQLGNILCYEPTMMIVDPDLNLLDYLICPTHLNAEMCTQATAIAQKIAKALDLVGILAVEMFITKNGLLLVNELAPRPHNSGHHTIESCNTSQFEQLMRIVLGLPLGDVTRKCCSIMLNIIDGLDEQDKDIDKKLAKVLSVKGAHLHWYGKTTYKPGRKIGHITILDELIENAHHKAAIIKNILDDK